VPVTCLLLPVSQLAAKRPHCQPPSGSPFPPAPRPSLQGMFSGSYGPHGLEVLQLTASSRAEDVPPGCPIDGPRLQGLKLIGDPNVPALR